MHPPPPPPKKKNSPPELSCCRRTHWKLLPACGTVADRNLGEIVWLTGQQLEWQPRFQCFQAVDKTSVLFVSLISWMRFARSQYTIGTYLLLSIWYLNWTWPCSSMFNLCMQLIYMSKKKIARDQMWVSAGVAKSCTCTRQELVWALFDCDLFYKLAQTLFSLSLSLSLSLSFSLSLSLSSLSLSLTHTHTQ